MAIQWQTTKNGYLVYRNTRTDQIARAWESDLDAIADVCRSWHDGEGSACHRMMKKDYSYRNMERTLTALARARDNAEANGIRINGDDWLDLLTAIDDLDGVVRRIRKIAD